MKIIKRLLIYGLGGSMLLASCQRKNEVISKEDAPITSSKVHTLDKAEMLQEKLSIQAQPQRSMDDAVAIAQTIRSNMAGLRAHTLPAVMVTSYLTFLIR